MFDLALLAHIGAGLTAVLAGLVAMLARKGGRWHITAGRVFLGGVVALFGSMVVMVVIRWPATIHLAVLGASPWPLCCSGGATGAVAAATADISRGWAWRTSRC